MYSLFEEDPHEIEKKCGEIDDILADLRPQDRMLWDAYRHCEFNLTRLASWLEKGKSGIMIGAASKTSLHREITRIKDYIYNRMTGKAKRYQACVMVEFWVTGDTDDVMKHLDSIEGDMIGIFSDYKNGTYKKTILK